MGGLESILSGQPVLASIRQFTKKSWKGALYFNELDVDDIYHSILDIIYSIKKRNKVIKEASKKETEFTWENVLQNLQRNKKFSL